MTFFVDRPRTRHRRAEGLQNRAPRPTSLEFSSVVPIRTAGVLPPLIFIPGVGGNLPDLSSLLNKIDPAYPAYGIQSQAFDPSGPALTKLEAIAAYHLEEIQRIVPGGPYCFIGFSFGAMVAFEMAQQLVAQGKQAPWLALIDSCEMGSRTESGGDTGTESVTHAVSQRLRARFREAMNHPDPLVYVWQKIVARFFRTLYSLLSKWGKPIPHWLRKAYHVNWFAAVNYFPCRYPGRITLFKAKEIVPGGPTPADAAWSRLAMGGIDVIETAGCHVNLFVEPNVGVLGSLLESALNRIFRS
jgi:thioesterase domain-containing protein